MIQTTNQNMIAMMNHGRMEYPILRQSGGGPVHVPVVEVYIETLQN